MREAHAPVGASLPAQEVVAGRRGHQFGRRIVAGATPVILLLLLVAAWEVAIRVLDTPEYVVPAPSAIAAELSEQRELLLRNAWVTFYESVFGFLLCIAVGLPLAILIVYSKIAERTIYPLIVASQTIPKVAIAPLMVFWFGFGAMPKVLIAFLIGFFPIVVSSVVGLGGTPTEMIYLVRSMGAGTLRTFSKVRFPYALPTIFAGLKISATLCVIGAIVGEFVGSSSGLGYLVLTAQGVLDARLIFASIFMMAVIGIVLFYTVDLIERVIVPWNVSEDRNKNLGGGG